MAESHSVTYPLFDVFQPGLLRGQEFLPYDPSKGYFYVEHPEEGWRVYLRAVCFIHEEGASFDPKRFLVVKRTGAHPGTKAWEPPKGQMEGKDALKHTRTHIIELLKQNVKREVEEEAHINVLHNLEHTGLIQQAIEPDFKPNTFFQYHIFRATTPVKSIQRGLNWFSWLQEHPKFFARMKRDKKEKDALAWFDPVHTRLMGRWSPILVPMYIQQYLPISTS
jgi:8-oxo-dGTP pyrophosphatase MutT (NUDIX family)